jgi:sugar/nucleoside kinase (ribokinase family)
MGAVFHASAEESQGVPASETQPSQFSPDSAKNGASEPANPNHGGRALLENGVENGHENGVVGLENGQERRQNGADVVGLQPVALVDHVARVDWSLLEAVPGERGGSMRVTEEELDHILREVNSHFLMSTNGAAEQGVKTLAGGSVANTIRGLAHGLGVATALVGVRGVDDRGQMFVENMAHAGVDLSRLRAIPGLTAQCACLVDAEGNRTMRTCFLNAVRLQAEELTRKDFQGAKWAVLNGYGFYGEDLLENAVDLCKKEGVKVSMDLASFEVVRNFRPTLMRLLESGKVDLVFANEDEARELIKAEENPCPETCLTFLSKYCERAVVMLGAKGCIARHGEETVRVSAIRETTTVDTTGAGDLFASGFLYGVLNNFSLEDCCKMGCCTGGAVVRGLGGEVAEEGWEWMQQQLKLKNLPPIQSASRVS